MADNNHTEFYSIQIRDSLNSKIVCVETTLQEINLFCMIFYEKIKQINHPYY